MKPEPLNLIATAFVTSADLKSIIYNELGLHQMNTILQAIDNSSASVLRETHATSLAKLLIAKSRSRVSQDDLEKEILLYFNESDKQRDSSKTGYSIDPPFFLYHRLDQLFPTPKICKYFKQLATLDTATLFLSSTAIRSTALPFNDESPSAIYKIVGYIKDCSGVASNPGLNPGVREDVLAISRISNIWKEKWKTGNMSKYVVRRYIATFSGAFLVYPGIAIDKSYQPTHRDWFKKAVNSPSRVVFTAPYLDVGGAGYIVTLSHAVMDKSHKVIGVMGIDFTLGYFHKFLIDTIDVCTEESITCFLMDDRGYLVAHPSLVEPAGRGPIEYTHITHKEPLVANDLLNHKDFMRKKTCTSYADCTIQRYYDLNVSMDSVLTNLVHGEHCAKYQITAIPETNIFIGVVNVSCDSMTAFCPCSVTDRLCLNCHRMEQTDCECPCECPIQSCQLTFHEDESVNSSFNSSQVESECHPFSEELVLPAIDRSDSVPSCFQVDCSTRRIESDCLGVLGCEWCQLDSYGRPLKEKFCNFQRECFGGMLGVRTPYADEIIDTINSEVPFSRVTPRSSIIFVFITCFILLFLVVFCYRYHVHRASNSLYIQTTALVAPNSTNVRMSQLDNESDDHHLHMQEPRILIEPETVKAPVSVVTSSSSALAMANFENAAAAVISPYRVNPGYRRPTGADSDNGYSTMTGGQDLTDSENVTGNAIVPARDALCRMPTSGTSLTTGSSSRASSPMDSTVASASFIKATLPPPPSHASKRNSTVMVTGNTSNLIAHTAQIHSNNAQVL